MRFRLTDERLSGTRDTAPLFLQRPEMSRKRRGGDDALGASEARKFRTVFGTTRGARCRRSDPSAHASVQARQFNNACKAALIEHAVNEARAHHALDLGCGGGGDIHKWRSVGVQVVVGVDACEQGILRSVERVRAAESAERRKRRRRGGRHHGGRHHGGRHRGGEGEEEEGLGRQEGHRAFRAAESRTRFAFVHADASKLSGFEAARAALRDATGGAVLFDVVSAQFSLHFFAGTPSPTRAGLADAFRHVAASMAQNGVFIATIVSAEALLRRMEKASAEEGGAARRYRGALFTVSASGLLAGARGREETDAVSGDEALDVYSFTMGNRVLGTVEALLPRRVVEEAAERAGLRVERWLRFSDVRASPSPGALRSLCLRHCHRAGLPLGAESLSADSFDLCSLYEMVVLRKPPPARRAGDHALPPSLSTAPTPSPPPPSRLPKS